MELGIGLLIFSEVVFFLRALLLEHRASAKAGGNAMWARSWPLRLF
jgi:hypothetical protein